MGRLERIVGTEIVDNLRLGHTWYEFGVLYLLIDSQLALGNSRTFVEVGVHEGGLPHLLIPEFPNLNYIGIEIAYGIVRSKVMQRCLTTNRAELIWGDCFNDAIVALLDSLTHKIIYCDGGDKAKELKHFKTLCHPGDILLSHDYYDGSSVFGVPPEYVPTNLEVTPKDIVHMVEDETFEPIAVPFKGTRIVAWRKL